MKEIAFREVQALGLEILKYFAKMCDENGFVYYITYGTLIGAVRHKGFIPWDDDIDVWMSRKDYDKLIEKYSRITQTCKKDCV